MALKNFRYCEHGNWIGLRPSDCHDCIRDEAKKDGIIKIDKLEAENATLKANWTELYNFIGYMYLNGKIKADQSFPIYKMMSEQEQRR